MLKAQHHVRATIHMKTLCETEKCMYGHDVGMLNFMGYLLASKVVVCMFYSMQFSVYAVLVIGYLCIEPESSWHC